MTHEGRHCFRLNLALKCSERGAKSDWLINAVALAITVSCVKTLRILVAGHQPSCG